VKWSKLTEEVDTVGATIEQMNKQRIGQFDERKNLLKKMFELSGGCADGSFLTSDDADQHAEYTRQLAELDKRNQGSSR